MCMNRHKESIQSSESQRSWPLFPFPHSRRALLLCWTLWNSLRFSVTRAHEPWIHGGRSARGKVRYRGTGRGSGCRFGARRPAASAVPEFRNFHRLSAFTKPATDPRAKISSGKKQNKKTSCLFARAVYSHELLFNVNNNKQIQEAESRRCAFSNVSHVFTNQT